MWLQEIYGRPRRWFLKFREFFDAGGVDRSVHGNARTRFAGIVSLAPRQS